MTSTDALRILALVPKAPGISPGQRFRIEQWAPHLGAKHGIAIDYAPFDSPALTSVLYQPGHYAEKAALILAAMARRPRDLVRAREYDAAFVYREVASLGPAIYERLLDGLRVPYVFDLDDSIWMAPPKLSNGVFSRLRFAGKSATIARHAAAVTVGNDYLAEWARQHARDVTVVPTTIDLSRYPLHPPRPPGDAFVIVWIGSYTTMKYLEIVREPIEALGRERAVELRVICDRPVDPPFAGVKNTFVPWSAENEAADIAAGDVGIMPLDDTLWTRGKCGCKALQYMAAGRPTVLAPVGVNLEVVRDRENGLFASTSAEWLTRLRELADDVALRQRLVAAGRTTVEERYASEIAAERLAHVFRRVARRRPAASARDLIERRSGDIGTASGGNGARR